MLSFKHVCMVFFSPFLCTGFAQSTSASETAIAIHVVDDDNNPIEGALVRWSWRDRGDNSPRTAKATTDQKGDSSQLVDGAPCVIVSKDGFYTDGISEDDGPRTYKSPFYTTIQPPVSVRLRKKIHPSPMLIRQLDDRSGKFPDSESPCGFDMIIGDWVPPHGHGKTSDFIANLKFDVRKHLDLDYQGGLVFPNPGDGVILCPIRARFRISELRLPPEAPVDGYQGSLAWNVLFGPGPAKYADVRAPRVPGPKDRNFENDNYFIRIRTKRSEDGTISGIYGKIHGQIQLGIGAINDIAVPVDAKPSVLFLYYMNPDGSRHLEWDKAHNLANDSEVSYEP